MTTTIQNSKKTGSKKVTVAPELLQGNYQLIPSEKILINANYRGVVYKKDLQEFAAELKMRGIISPVTVRPISNRNFELVAGERRLKAAAIAKIALIPCIVKELSDEEVLEIQLSENLNRENPHPLQEAFAILQMQQSGKSFEDICTRMVKSKSFVYHRLKLAELDVCFHGVYFANKITTALAFRLAELSPQSQQKLYEAHFKSWDDDNFKIGYHLENIIQNLRFDLREANFNIRSKSLIPEAGACMGCRYNSATLGSLFPEMAKKAVCSNAECFHQKSLAHYRNLFNKALEKEQPEAIITHSNNDLLEKLIEENEIAKTLPVYNYYNVNVLDEPEQPSLEEYEQSCDDDEPQSINAAFEQAMTEYKDELEAIENAKQTGELKKAIYLIKDKIEILWFGEHYSNKNRNGNQPTVTAKAVQEAIKSGVMTKDLLQAEISRIQEREKRALELDREKVQLKVHESFKATLEQTVEGTTLTPADLIAQRFLVYESLDWNAKQRVDKLLFVDNEKSTSERFYQKLSELTETEHSILIRLAIAEKSGSQYPNQMAGYVLYKTAEGAGLDTESIEQKQSAKAKERKGKMLARITELEKKVQEME